MNYLAKPIANPVVVLREEFDDWAVLFNPDTADAVGINPVGVTVWKQMDGTRSIEDIVSVVQSNFEDVPEAVHEEIVAFVQMLEKNGFVGLALKSNI
ncbi:MAG: SynChlorMet cassette protein ScmD [Candidatus Riflebacteria bacterium]|nr:SynChlorMet cassette protein ScmD [Candidatus Riflebacteria bacterium]